LAPTPAALILKTDNLPDGFCKRFHVRYVVKGNPFVDLQYGIDGHKSSDRDGYG